MFPYVHTSFSFIPNVQVGYQLISTCLPRSIVFNVLLVVNRNMYFFFSFVSFYISLSVYVKVEEEAA